MLRRRGFSWSILLPPHPRAVTIWSPEGTAARQRSAVLCENSDLCQRNSVRTVFQFERTRAKPKHASGSLRVQRCHLAVRRSIASPLSQLLSAFSSCRLISVHVCSRGFGPNEAKKPQAGIRATSKITLMTRGLEEEKSREMGLVELLGLA